MPISGPEALYLMGGIARLPPERGAVLTERFERVGREVDLAKLSEPLLRRGRGPDLAAAYFGLRLACPFLEEDSCSIHPHPPVG